MNYIADEFKEYGIDLRSDECHSKLMEASERLR